MNIKDNQPDIPAELRCRAEKIIRRETRPVSDDLITLSREEISELVHELEVHKIELEMQNDELCAAQEELEDSRQRYLDLYELAPMGYFIVNKKGVIINANLTAATLLGQPRGNLINKPISELILRKDFHRYTDQWKILFETGTPQTVELRMLRNGNSVFCARLNSIIAENTGAPTVCRVTLIDISESKQLEHTLQKRIKELYFFFRFSSLLEKPDISIDEVLEKIMLLIPQAWQFPEITAACIDLGGQIFQTKNFRETQWMITSDIIIQEKKAGNVAVCYTENRPEFNRELFSIEESYLLNSIAEMLGRVVTRIRIAEAVKHSEKFLRTAINSMTNPFAVINANDYTIELANDAYGGKKVTGRKCHAVWRLQSSPCTDDDYPCPVREVQKKQKSFVREYTLYDDLGNPTSTEIFAFPVFDSNGQLTQIIINRINVTNRKRSELKLEQKAAELKDMNAALKVLLKRRELDKDDIEQNIFANYKMLITPIIQDLKTTLTQENQEEIVESLELSFKNILSPFSKNLSDKLINLTPTEIHVAQLIKSGKSNKEIAQFLNCSVHTVSRHRDNIRAKTNLKNKKMNLRSFLLSLE
ncbi:PAS and helix-turn-helix domain-containing protein [uncultured Desulfobacter sp.]|uniref:PAS and helix-turn-helix domain-containing protein n=1 Tax=uncultured Desulfobacter sp. TaxID=240139 RepID=UPI002AABB791|nr:PAS and helix-turn-helix domain-containing protein [uncultured Desulfobacter sp.]